jgi:hypothetical protein
LVGEEEALDAVEESEVAEPRSTAVSAGFTGPQAATVTAKSAIKRVLLDCTFSGATA